MKNLLMTTIAIFGLALFTNAQVPNYIPTNGLVAWWPFNGNANDESLNGNNGTVNGAVLSTDRFGVSEKAYSFSSDFITVPHQNSLNAFPISVFAWINGNPLSYTNAIITKYPSSSNNGWTIHAASGKLSGYYFNFQGGSEMNYDMFPSELTQVVDNNWHHVGMIVTISLRGYMLMEKWFLKKTIGETEVRVLPPMIATYILGKILELLTLVGISTVKSTILVFGTAH